MVRAIYVPNFERTVDVKIVENAKFNTAVTGNGIKNPLEVSSRSKSQFGKSLSAFNLKAYSPTGTHSTVERFYQGSKVFENGGPYQDIYFGSGNPKSDPRIKNSGEIVGYKYSNKDFPLNPNGAFYNWLYCNALRRLPRILDRLKEFDGFTDMFYDPRRGNNCQAFACALFVATDGFKDISIREALERQDNSHLAK